MKLFRLFVFVLAVLGVACLVCGETRQVPTSSVTVPFEDLNILSPLPDYCYAMPRPLYEKWCDMQNKGAYRQAERLADAARMRFPARETYVQDQDYSADVQQVQSESVGPTEANFAGNERTEYRGRNVQNVFQTGQSAGGPVVLLNPYTARPATVLYDETGVAYVADPDKTLTPEEAAELLKKNE